MLGVGSRRYLPTPGAANAVHYRRTGTDTVDPMATPEFILKLREKIGHDPLWLSGAGAVVVRDGEVLLVKRADNGAWTPITGIIDPGEEPAQAARRELLEEAGVVGEPVRVTSIRVSPMVTFANGDQTQFIAIDFLFRWVSGEPHPADGENTEARWFPVDDLPPMSEWHRSNVDRALAGGEATYFVP